MTDAWEGWIRPLLVIGLLAAGGAAWYFEWLPDTTLGAIVWAALAVLGIAVVTARTFGLQLLTSRAAQLLSVLSIASSVALAAWVPWTMAGPDAVLLEGPVPESGASLPLDATGGTEQLIVAFGAQPTFGQRDAELRVALTPPGRHPEVRLGKLDAAQASKHAADIAERRTSWRVSVDLSAGAAINVSATPPSSLRWPARLTIARAGPPLGLLAGLAAIVLLLGVAVEARSKRGERTGLGRLAAAAGAFALLAAGWYAPGSLTETVFAAALAGTILGTAAELIVRPIARALLAKAPVDAPAPAGRGSGR